MTPEQLLIPRYKLIADYPCRPHPIGSIIEFTNDPYDTRVLFTLPGSEHRYPESKLKEYPHLFKRLEWWEERKKEDLPAYLKAVDALSLRRGKMFFKVVEWSLEDEDCFMAEGDDLYTWVRGYVPTTESEYLTYINSKK